MSSDTSKLSRRLFTKPVRIRPKKVWGEGSLGVEKLGKMVETKPLRSDIKSIHTLEGEDYATFDRYKQAVRTGRIHRGGVDFSVPSEVSQSFEDLRKPHTYQKWYSEAHPQIPSRGGGGDPWERGYIPYTAGRVDFTKQFRTKEEIMATPDYMEDKRYYRRPFPAIPVRYDQKGNLVYESGKILGRGKNLEGKIVSDTELENLKVIYEKEGRFDRKKQLSYDRGKKEDRPTQAGETYRRMYSPGRMGRSEGEGAMIRYTGAAIVLSENLSKMKEAEDYGEFVKKKKGKGILVLEDEERDAKIKELEKQRSKMTRAQQRKLGRVIRAGKTGPMKAERTIEVMGSEKVPIRHHTEMDVVGGRVIAPKGKLEYEIGVEGTRDAKLEAERDLARVAYRKATDVGQEVWEKRRKKSAEIASFKKEYKSEGDITPEQRKFLAREKETLEALRKEYSEKKEIARGFQREMTKKRDAIDELGKPKTDKFEDTYKSEAEWKEAVSKFKTRLKGKKVVRKDKGLPWETKPFFLKRSEPPKDEKDLSKWLMKKQLLSHKEGVFDKEKFLAKRKVDVEGKTYYQMKEEDIDTYRGKIKLGESGEFQVLKEGEGGGRWRYDPKGTEVLPFGHREKEGDYIQQEGSGFRVMEGGKVDYSHPLYAGKIIRVDKIKREKKKKLRKRRLRMKASMMNNPNFSLSVARGGGRRVFHMEEGKTKGWKEVQPNRYTKQVQAWKNLDVSKVPSSELQLRGIRDNRTAGGRLIGRGIRPSRSAGRGGYKSARDEALIQMRINESVGVRDLRTKKDKEIKEIRISEAQKALNLKLAKETAEKTTDALKAKNAGLTHSYNVNVRNQSAATLLGSSPDELNKLLKKGGGLALVKAMVRKGEISDVSTIGQLNLSSKQKDNLQRLLMEGGDFVEGQEYFFRHLVEGQTRVQRGYLNKGGERKDNLELMYIRTNPDGSQSSEKFLVPKSNILKPDDYTTTTTSGKRQAPVARELTEFELDLFREEGASPPPHREVKHEGKVLTKYKGRELREPTQSPREVGVLGILRQQQPTAEERWGGDVEVEQEPRERTSSEEEPFDFGGGELGEEFMLGMTSAEREEIIEARTPRLTAVDSDLDALTHTGSRELRGVVEAGRQARGAEGFEGSYAEHQARLEAEQIGGMMPRPEPEPQGLEAGMAEQIATELGGGMESTEVLHLRLAAEREAERQLEAIREAEEIMGSPTLTAEQREAELGKLKEKALSPKRAEEEVKPPTIQEEIGALTSGEGMPPSQYTGWSGSEEMPEELIQEDWDMRTKGMKERLSKEVPKGSVAIWTTKHNPRDNQNVLVVDANDAYHILRGLRGVGVRNDKGNMGTTTDAKLKSLYRKVLENTRSGKREVAINDKQMLRLLELVPLYAEAEEEDT